MNFKNRTEAGRLLAKRLSQEYFSDPIVLALPRGGVPVGYEIAKELNIPFDVLVVRKVGAPTCPEFGIGAITEDGYYWVDFTTAKVMGYQTSEIKAVLTQEYKELNRRIRTYRGDRLIPSLSGRTVIVVDDGLATGITAKVVCNYIKSHNPKKIILAVPVSSPNTAESIRAEVDEVICLSEPENFFAIGQFYENFDQLTDQDVIKVLTRAHETHPDNRVPVPIQNGTVREDIVIQSGEVELNGSIQIPRNAMGIVLFAHGSGSGKLSPRNKQVARKLNQLGIGTLLFDLLTQDESGDRKNVFDIPLLSRRLALATSWVKDKPYASNLPIGFFGASTGAGAALWAAADLKKEIAAVVSRGGRPDLAMERLPEVTAPTLLIVGQNDRLVLEMNQDAKRRLKNAELVIIPKASHLFEENGALEEVTDIAANWFRRCFVKKARYEAA